jgi:hypothetical protein
MARSLTFTLGKNSFDCTIHKVERTKLYGSRSIETLDMDGNKCNLATLLDDGKTLVPYGGTASGYINPDGEWVCRADITPVNFEGEKLEKVPSSFTAGMPLDEEISAEEFLDHSIRLTYALSINKEKNETMDKAFLKSIKKGVIFKTSFSYRGGVDPDPAFVMQGEDGTIWLLIGGENRVSYSKLEQAAVIEATAGKDEGAETSGDELDFGML